MRKLFLEDPLHPKGGIEIRVKRDKDCVFCKHCTDVFWDYTNLIYMVFCRIDQDTNKEECEHFEEQAEE